MADNNTIARPYARAAFDVAKGAARLEDWSAALRAAAELLDDSRVTELLGHPSLSDEERLGFLQDLLAEAGASQVLDGSDEKGTNFLKLLLEYGRIDVLPEISEHFDAHKARVENTVEVTVRSAVALSDAQQQEIAAALKSRLSREVRLGVEIDESLIAGAVIRAGDVVIDGSLRARLTSLANALVA